MKRTDNLFFSKIAIGIFLMIFLGSHSAWAKTLRIVSLQLHPFGFHDGDTSRGILYDFGNRIAEEAGFSYENKIVPYTRAIKMLEIGEADFCMLFPNDMLDKCAVKVVPVMMLENIIVGLKGTKFDSLEALHGKSVATVRDAQYDDAFLADKAIQKIETYHYEQSVKILFAGRVDAMIGPKTGLYFTVRKLGFSAEKLGEPLVLNTKDVWLHFSKKNR